MTTYRKSKMADISSTMSIMTLNMKGLNRGGDCQRGFCEKPSSVCFL
jgi:hypothetical protein